VAKERDMSQIAAVLNFVHRTDQKIESQTRSWKWDYVRNIVHYPDLEKPA